MKFKVHAEVFPAEGCHKQQTLIFCIAMILPKVTSTMLKNFKYASFETHCLIDLCQQTSAFQRLFLPPLRYGVMLKIAKPFELNYVHANFSPAFPSPVVNWFFGGSHISGGVITFHSNTNDFLLSFLWAVFFLLLLVYFPLWTTDWWHKSIIYTLSVSLCTSRQRHFLRQGSKLQPVAKYCPGSHFYRPQKHFVKNAKVIYLWKFCWLMWYILKQSHYVKCPALELLCNSLCGPRTKNTGDPVLREKVH